MGIERNWGRYRNETMFNYSVLPEEVRRLGDELVFEPKQFIVSRGDTLRYIYFIKSGAALGTRNYADGNEYNYFLVDGGSGNIGLLEMFAMEEEYVASILCTTKVTALRIDAGIVYNYVMNSKEMLQRCLSLVARDLYKRSANDGRFYYLDGINRVRYYFVDYYNEHLKNGKEMIVHAEYRDIAANVGISVRTVGRSIQKLKSTGEIRSRDKKVVIDERNYRLLLSSLDL